MRIEMPFEKIQFLGGLGTNGQVKKQWRGKQVYTITDYRDLDALLGRNWHFRGINAAGDFCYVILNTVEFYLYRRCPLTEYFPDSTGAITKHERDQAYALMFTFIRGDGTRDQFGTDPAIFF